MANKKVATGSVDGNGVFRHEDWETGVDQVVDPDGNPIGGGGDSVYEWFKPGFHDDMFDNLTTVTGPAPWEYRYPYLPII